MRVLTHFIVRFLLVVDRAPNQSPEPTAVAAAVAIHAASRRWLSFWSLGALAVMKKSVIVLIVLAVLVAFFFVLLYGTARGDRRARFINTMNDLREAHFELQKYGAFTNQFRYETVYPFTNQFVVDGTDYQCEFAVECEEFTNRGFLTITTNDIFVWIDKKRGVMPLGRVPAFTFPPGF